MRGRPILASGRDATLRQAMGTRLDPEAIAAAHAAARASWPTVEVPLEHFAQWIEARLEEGEPLEALRTSDLYLACACASNEPHALAVFEQKMLADVDRALHRLSMSSTAIDETKQVLRRRFFISLDGAPPRIADYAGRGDLRSWVRAAAVRAALRVVRRPKGEVDVESSVMRAVPAQADDLELDYFKRRYRAAFEESLREVFAALPARDRNMVRYYFAEGLSIDALGVLYGIHRATAARQVKRVTNALMNGARKALTTRLHADQSEISSIVRMIQSQLDVTLRVVLTEEKNA